jgi:hypothetical protein
MAWPENEFPCKVKMLFTALFYEAHAAFQKNIIDGMNSRRIEQTKRILTQTSNPEKHKPLTFQQGA